MSLEDQHPIEVLTQEALSASEKGLWDQVASLYQRRASEFDLKELSQAIAKRLINIDQVIQERARVVQAATQQGLDEAQEQRRKLRQWKQQWTYSSQAEARFVKSV